MVLLSTRLVGVICEYVRKFITDNTAADTSLLAKWNDENNVKSLRDYVDGKCFNKNPPRVVSRYLYFCDEERKKILDEINLGILPKMNIREVTKELGKRWKEFNNDDVANNGTTGNDGNVRVDANRAQKINRLYEEDKNRYYRQKREYAQAFSDADITTRPLRKIKRTCRQSDSVVASA